MYHLCFLFVWLVSALNRPTMCSPAVNYTNHNSTNLTSTNNNSTHHTSTNYTSISNRDAISEEDQIRALENTALLEGDLVTPAKENSTEAGSAMHSVPRISSRWPNGIIYFKLDKRFYGEFWTPESG